MAELYRIETDGVIQCPTYVKGRIAIAEFKRIVDELQKRNMATVLDINTIANYCIAYANYRKVTEELEDCPFIIEKDTKMGKQLVEHPLIATQLKYSNEMDKLGSKLGLNIVSRQKIKGTDKKRTSKFDKFSASK